MSVDPICPQPSLTGDRDPGRALALQVQRRQLRGPPEENTSNSSNDYRHNDNDNDNDNMNMNNGNHTSH